jgi:hypothetical protein
MSASLESARAPRPLKFWSERYPPGYLAQPSAAEADPLEIAAEIARLAGEFIVWLRLPAAERWDAYRMQAFGAALFNRYRTVTSGTGVLESAIGLLDLDWPAGSEDVREAIDRMQELVRAPLAVYKMLRIAADSADYPTQQELNIAMSDLEAKRDALEESTNRLLAALADYEHRNRYELTAQAAMRRSRRREVVTMYPAACSRSA